MAVTIKLVLLYLYRPRDTPELDDDGPRRSESENDRDSESSNSESDFNDKKAQSMFDNWMVSLPTTFESENSGRSSDGLIQESPEDECDGCCQRDCLNYRLQRENGETVSQKILYSEGEV